MSLQKLEITQDSRQPVDQLFAALADHNRLGPVLGIPVRRVREGHRETNGVGSVRRMGFGPLALEETVTALEANRSIDYRISRGGGPIRQHRGRLEFASTPGGSRVTWSIEFESALPLLGLLVKQVLSQGLRLGLKRLA